jgi:hypothetical protein
MKCAVRVSFGGKIYIPNFMKTPPSIQAMLRLLPQHFIGCNVCVTDGRIYK